jgi:uncharacterized protein YuzE
MTFSYDRHADVLYIMFEEIPPSAYIFVENEYGDVLKLDRVSRRVVGCTIPCFIARTRQGKISIPEIGAVPFNEIAGELVGQ